MNPSDIVTCNGPQLASLRKSGGLTQDELAHEARLSVRVIRKAEKSGNIRFSTLSAIAEALRTHGADAAAERLCCDPVTIAQQFVEAYRRHEEKMTDHIRHLLCPDLEVFVAGDPSQIPFAGTFHGPDGLQEMWCRFFGLIERYDKTALNLQYFVNGNEVVAYGTEKGRIKGHTNDEPTWLALKFRITNGRIVRFEDYFDTASAQEHIREFLARSGESDETDGGLEESGRE